MPPEINEKKKGQRIKKPALDRKKKDEGDDNINKNKDPLVVYISKVTNSGKVVIRANQDLNLESLNKRLGKPDNETETVI